MNEYDGEGGIRGDYDISDTPLFYLFEGDVAELEVPQRDDSQLTDMVSK